MRNLAGGLVVGNAYVIGDLGTGATGLWPAGHLHVSFLNIASAQPSATLIGDEQGASNIAAPSRTRLYSFWYRQGFDRGRLAVLVGIRPVNGSFAYSTYANTFINSSFGIVLTISANVAASIWPEPGLGAQIAYRPDRAWRLLTGIFQGNPKRRGDLFSTGAMSISEGDFYRQGAYPGSYKVRFWYDQSHRSPVMASLVSHADRGFYGVVDQVFWHGAGRRRLSLFLQFGNALGANNLVGQYWGGGVLAMGWLPSFPGSLVGMGVARAQNTPAAQRLLGIPAAETAWELTGIWQLNREFAVQPDLQYIQGPSGRAGVPNALMAILRIVMTFTRF